MHLDTRHSQPTQKGKDAWDEIWDQSNKNSNSMVQFLVYAFVKMKWEY